MLAHLELEPRNLLQSTTHDLDVGLHTTRDRFGELEVFAHAAVPTQL